jgi:hypothetical protein
MTSNLPSPLPPVQSISIGGKPTVGSYHTWLPVGYYSGAGGIYPPITIPDNRLFASLFLVPVDVLFNQVSYSCVSAAPPLVVSGIWIGVYDYQGVLLLRGHGSALIPAPLLSISRSIALSGKLAQGMYYAAACSDGTQVNDPEIFCLGQKEVHVLSEDAAPLKKWSGELALAPAGALPNTFDPTLLTYAAGSIGPALRFDL